MAKVYLILAVVICGAYSAWAQQPQRECKVESYKQCFSELKKEKEASKDKPFTAEGLEKKCSLFSDAEECLMGYKDVCEKAGKWEEMSTVGFGTKNKMKELCNNTETKTEFLKHLACFNENREAIMTCFKKFKAADENAPENVDPSKKMCCKSKAANDCTKEVTIVKCPAAKQVLEKLLQKAQEKTKDFCVSKGYVNQCAAGAAAGAVAGAVPVPTTPRAGRR